MREVRSAHTSRIRRKHEVIVIAPLGVTVHVFGGGPRYETRYFSSVENFERWRSGAAHHPHDIGPFVDAALLDLRCDPDACSARVRALLEWLRAQPRVPTLKRFSLAATSRRSFFRAWSADVPEKASRFLLHVRVLHARALLDDGTPVSETVTRAGFHSLRELQRYVARVGTT